MKLKLFLACSALLFSTTSFSSNEDAQQLVNSMCVSCHVSKGKPTIAPPLIGVVNHVKSKYPTREAFIQRIVDWVEQPDADNAIMAGAVKRFGLMPKLSYASADVRKIAAYLYDDKANLPAWYQKHFKDEHGHSPKKH